MSDDDQPSQALRTRTRRWLPASLAVVVVAPLLGFVGVGSVAAEEAERYVVASLSGNPADLRDNFGRLVEVVKADGDGDDSAEQVSVVRTVDSGLARVITQWGQPRSEVVLPEPGTYPVASGEDEVVDPDGFASVTSGFSFADMKTVSRADLEVAFVSAVSETSASLAWRAKPGAVHYVVTRDGVEVARVTDTSFTDRGLDPGQRYVYEIASETGSHERGGGSRSIRTVPLETLSSQASRLNDIDGIISPMAWQYYTTAFTYKTFITNQYQEVDSVMAAGCDADVGDFFGGDNRLHEYPGIGAPYSTPSYKTQAFINVNWDNPDPWDVVTVKLASPSRLYNSSMVLKDTRTASTSGLVFAGPVRSTNYVTLSISHEVGNPFCVVSAIRYSLPWVEFYRSGTVSFDGSRQPVPAHEAYARFSDVSGGETWYWMYSGAQGSFLCTLPAMCLSEDIGASRSN